MINNLPVIASSVGGLTEVVSDGVTGFLIPPFSPVSLAEKIMKLIEDPRLRLSMGEAGFQKAMENYTAKRYCLEVEKLYLGLLQLKNFSFS